MARKDIIQELNDLGSSLENTTTGNIYSIPEGYFEGFAQQVLGRIKAEEKGLEFLSLLSKENPYQVPVGYFKNLPQNIMEGIRRHADYQTSREELESISPLLNSLNKKPVFSVPDNYFANFEVAPGKKTEAKVVLLASRKWIRYAAAAVITGVIALSTFSILNKKKIDPNKNPEGWVAKNMKKVSPEVINEFVKLADEELPLKESTATTNKTDDIKELMKDVSVNEIDKFLDETGSSDENENNSLMN
jgi:hypothetical protein